MAVDEEADFRRPPSGGMAVAHAGFDTNRAVGFHRGDAARVAVERVVNVLVAVDEEHGNAAGGQIAGRVVMLYPLLAQFRPEGVDGFFLDGFSFVQKAAAVDRDGGFEAIVE